MIQATAWAPGNISLLFKVMPDPDPAKMGSLGAGFTVDKGATVTVSESEKTRVLYNGISVELPTVTEVIHALTDKPISVSIESPLPLGSGFGMSGASALATAYAINELYALEKPSRELLNIAHTAEVVSKTGLGDVANQQYGGCCVKFVTSALFEMERLPFTGTKVWAKSWGKIPTPTILADQPLLARIDGVAERCLAQIKKDMTSAQFHFSDLLAISNTFTKETGLLSYAPHSAKTIQSIEKEGGHAAMIILGDAVVSDIPFPGAMELTISEETVKIFL